MVLVPGQLVCTLLQDATQPATSKNRGLRGLPKNPVLELLPHDNPPLLLWPLAPLPTLQVPPLQRGSPSCNQTGWGNPLGSGAALKKVGKSLRQPEGP